MKDSIVFGINLSHDTSCAALVNGEVAIAIEEERLNRIRHWNGVTESGRIIPFLGIDYCLDYLGIDGLQVDLWVGNACFPRAIDILRTQLIGVPDERIIDVELPGHHLAHAYSSFYASPFEEAAVLILDVNGGYNSECKENYSIYRASADGITPVHLDLLKLGEMSIAEVYMVYAAILQLSPREGGDYGKDDVQASGGKLMGYAAHALAGDQPEHKDQDASFASPGKSSSAVSGPSREFRLPPLLESADDHHVVKIRKLVEYLDSRDLVAAEKGEPPYEEIFGLGMKRYVEWNYRQDSLHESRNMLLGQEAQALLEDGILRMAHLAYQKTGSKNLCVAGGTMLNVVACTKILEETPFENIFVQPAATDGGNAIGAAFYGYYKHLRLNERPYLLKPYHTCHGRSYSQDQIEMTLTEKWDYPFEYKRIDDEDEQIERLLEYLLEDEVVCVFRGRSEFGPRALGNRSFLASPRSEEMLQKMNEIKKRAWYRPVAPVVLEEEFENFFEAPFSSSPFMTLATRCKEHTRRVAPAICHVDGSARVQTVSEKQNPFITRLLQAFFETTGVPMLINTSLNIKEPIAETPADAVKTFLLGYGKVRCLLIEDYLVEPVAWVASTLFSPNFRELEPRAAGRYFGVEDE